jgi:hypothetical protein
MLSRALSIATVTLLIGCLTAGVARAAENLDAGKSPSQIFSNTCSACHKSPRGLLKNTPASSLPGFLRQHYTTGTDMASVLSSYLLSNGAADPRYQSKDPSKKDARRDARQDPRLDPRQDARQDTRPEQPERLGRRQPAAAQDADAARPQGEGARRGRDGRRYGRPRVAPEAADGQAPVQAATDSKPPGRQKQGRRGRPVAAPEEPPRTEQVVPDTAKEDRTSRDVSRSDSAATESARPAAARPDSDSARPDPSSTDAIGSGVREMRPESSRIEGVRDISEPNPLRPDPVTSTPASVAADLPSAPATTSAAPMTAAPAGPPTPPISR